MKRQGFVALGAFVAFAMFSVSPVLAQDEEFAADNAADSTVEAEDKVAAALESKQRGLLSYFSLVRCDEVKGDVRVLRPHTDTPVKAQLGKYYPLGSIIIAGNSSGRRNVEPSSATFNFGKAVMVKVTEGSELGTRDPGENDKCRTVVLRKGRVELILPRQMKDGEFEVAAPHFVFKNMNGNSWIDYSASNNCDRTTLHLVTGLMGVEGAHYTIPQMRAGDELVITTNEDDAFSCISSNAGIYNVVLDQGMRRDKDFETNEYKETDVKYTFELTPKSKVKIWRRRPTVGGNMVVSTMAIDATGTIKSRRVFAEKRYNINSGELVITQKDREAAAAAMQQLGEADETDTVAVTPADEPAATTAPADSEQPSDGDSTDDLF
jgi:hypothetical protein